MLPIYIFVFASLSNVALCLDCYTCNSLHDKHCENPLETPDLTPRECVWNNEKILKLSDAINKLTIEKVGKGFIPTESITLNFNTPQACQKIIFKDGDKRVIGRGCASSKLSWYDPCESLQQMFGESDKKLESCTLCTSDKCNKTTAVVISYFPILCGIVFLYNFSF